MKSTYLILGILTLSVLGCGKDEDEQPLGGEPISIKSPATNPANTSTGSPINFNVELSMGGYIDSVFLYYQVDSSAIPQYQEANDTLFRKEVYFLGNQENRKFIAGSFIPKKFPPVGKKIYFTIKLYSTETVDRITSVITRKKTQVLQVL